MANPLITTIIPTFRRPLLLRRAINSALSQTLCDLRVCVCDNASNDETETTVRALQSIDSRIDYYQHPLDIGAIKNFNFGLGKVESKYFSLLSDDDFLLPDFYKLATAALEAHPAAAFATTEVLWVDKTMRLFNRSNDRWKPGYYPVPAGLMAMCNANNDRPTWTGILFRREVLDAVGILDAEVGVWPVEHDYIRRIAAKFPFVVLPSVGAVFVDHPGSTSGPLTLSTLWPGKRKAMQNLLLDESLPLPLRRRLRSALEYETSRTVFILAWTALIQGRLGECRRGAEILRCEFRRRWRAGFLTIWACLAEKSPMLRSFVARDPLRPWHAFTRTWLLISRWRRHRYRIDR